MKTYSHFLLVILFLVIESSFSFGSCSLPLPTGLKLKNQTSCSIDVAWKKVTGSAYYLVEYRVQGTSTWSFSGQITSTSATLSNLASNTTYEVAVASFCNDNTTAGYSAPLTKLTKKCSAPANIFCNSVTTSSATINWTAVCGADLFNLQYRKSGVTAWTKVKAISATTYNLTGLDIGTAYEYRVQADCGSVNSSYSSTSSFLTLSPGSPKKNILFVLLDDARYDCVAPNGAPSWFVTPGITKIAEEGVNFKLTIPTTSQCGPSRACIYTGLYPHINGTTKNGDTLNLSFITIQQILKDNGYFTGFIGKYGQYFGDPIGFNWWATSQTDDYVNPPYRMNGIDTSFSGNLIEVYPRLAKTFLNSVPAGKNFALFYFTKVPHDPTIPTSHDSLLYLNEIKPFPSNFSFYDNNYPSFYQDEKWNVDTPKVANLIQRTFQTIKGADDNVDSIFNWIIQRDGTLDSTLIIFTSDNGYLLGEHHMREKIVALEESFRVPLFIRYPKWFAANTVISDEIASNIDIAPTLLEYAGLPNVYGFQGLSLHALSEGTLTRKNFFYETGWDPYVAKLRAVRTLNDIYIRSYCKTTCEEYYDLTVDANEDSNLIFKGPYQTTIAARRILLDSLRTAFNDITPTKKACSLITTGGRYSLYNGDEAPEIDFALFPNPASSSFSFYFTSHVKAPATIGIYDELGNLYWNNTWQSTLDVLEEIDCSNWSNGFYMIKVQQGTHVFGRKILIQN